MSMFPTIGSTVTNVSTTKTGTAARIEFSDGSSIYVKYDALLISEPKKVEIRSTEPFVHKNSMTKTRVEQHFANLPKKQVLNNLQNQSINPGSFKKTIMDNNSHVSEEALLEAKLRSESRIDRLAAKWDSEHPSGEAAIAAMNG